MTTLNVCNKNRTVLTEILPYEVPLFFDNYGFYCVLNNKNQSRIFKEQFDCLKINLKNEDKSGIIQYRWFIPFNYRVRKSNGESRSLSIVHPINQLEIIDFYEKYAKFFLYLCKKSPFSIRHVDSIAKCTFDRDEVEEIEDDDEYDEIQISKKYRHYFDYEKIGMLYKFYDSIDYIHLESKYKYCLTLDLAKCFYHIYTHSISWAVKGKKYSKDNLRAKSLETNFDKLMQHCNYNETNGIVVGPEMSRIFAEIILQEIDLKIIDDLKSEGLSLGRDYEVRRYVDDSFIFFNNLQIENLIKEKFKKRCEEYKLYINEKKLKLITRPFASDITVAKKEVKDLVKRLKQHYFEKNEHGMYVKKFKDSIKGIQFFSQELGAIAHRNKVSYSDVGRYCLYLISKMLEREFNSEGALPSEGQLLSFIEISFFLFSLDMNMSNSKKLSKIINDIVDWSDKLDDEFCKQNIIDRLRREFKRCMDIYISTSKKEQTNIEILNILLVLHRKISLVLSDEMIYSIFGYAPKDTPSEWCRKLDYFQICSILYLVENKSPFIYKNIIDELKNRFKRENPLIESELSLLYFDILSCPFVDSADKKEIIKAVYPKEGSKIKKRLNDVSSVKRWFFNWDKQKKISDILEKNDYIHHYQ